MKITYVATFNSRDIKSSNNWAGTGYYIPESLKKQSLSIQYIDSLKENLVTKTVGKFKRCYYEVLSKGTYFKGLDPIILSNYANQVSKELSKIETDIVFSSTITPISYLECSKPIVFWADATFENMLNFYPQYTGLCEESIRHGHLMERLALQRCKLAIYSSDWAAQSAINHYNADPSKVKVIPFGANIENSFSSESIKGFINERASDSCKLLFIGVDWVRKDGDVAYQIAKNLNQSGLKTELTIVGCQPIFETVNSLPDFVKVLGYINKSTSSGKEKINQLIAESHFLILPSKAECYGIVLCEANSLGVPCISSNVGGIPTVIKEDINGKLFDFDNNINECCDYITNLFANYDDYKNLAISTFHEYELRLNWNISGQKVKKLLMSLV